MADNLNSVVADLLDKHGVRKVMYVIADIVRREFGPDESRLVWSLGEYLHHTQEKPAKERT